MGVMNILHTQKVIQPAVLARTLFKLERSGKYAEGLAEAKDFWADKTILPNVGEFAPRDAAEILLRCGSLYGFFGHTRHLPKAQETSKDILMKARTRFQDIYDIEKIAECENYLALAYWRTGEYHEAETWIAESFSHKLPNSNSTRLFSNIIKCLLNLSFSRYEENRENLTALEKYFLACDDNYLKGDFYSYLGLGEKCIGSPDKALRYFEMARHYYAKAGHKIYQALAANNIAQIYKMQKKFALSHSAIDNATDLFRKSKDRTREGFSFDTRAQIFFEEGKYAEALDAAGKGIAILKRGENSGYLAEAYLTKSVIEIFLHNDLSAAILSLLESVNIARTNIGEEKAEGLVREFEAALVKKNSAAAQPPTPVFSAKDNLNLVLPPILAHYTEYQGVWINNTHLESAGLRQGTLAVIVKEPVKKGDLAAVAENETEEISCGFYDRDFGIICLEGPDSPPLLFDENKVVVLGKIVGFCDPAKETGGKMMVEAIKNSR